VFGRELEAARRDHALDVGTLVLRVALAFAHAQVDGRTVPPADRRTTPGLRLRVSVFSAPGPPSRWLLSVPRQITAGTADSNGRLSFSFHVRQAKPG
jgi:hypothetical protein